MNTETPKKILKILKKQIHTTKNHLLKLKLLEYENEFCYVSSVTNILIKEEHLFLLEN